MPKYRVIIKQTDRYCIEIKALNPTQAVEEAFTLYSEGDFEAVVEREIEELEEVKEDA